MSSLLANLKKKVLTHHAKAKEPLLVTGDGFAAPLLSSDIVPVTCHQGQGRDPPPAYGEVWADDFTVEPLSICATLEELSGEPKPQRDAEATVERIVIYKAFPSVRLGLTLSADHPHHSYIDSTKPGSKAEKVFGRGDLILQVNGIRCKCPMDTAELLRESDGYIEVHVMRQEDVAAVQQH